MKKLSAVFATVLLLAFFSVCSVASAYDYSIAEAEFDIPEDFAVLYGEEDMPETEKFRFIALNNSVKLSCYHLDNTDEFSFAFMNLADAVDYYIENISAVDADDYTFESAQTYNADGLNDGIMFEGLIEESDENFPVFVYAFSTTDNIYGFEFTVYDSSGIEYVNEVVNSLYITDYATYIGDEEYEGNDGFFELFSLIAFLVVGIASTLLKSKMNNTKKEKTAAKPSVKIQNAQEKQPTEKIQLKKFELNGKDINIFNERFIVGKTDDNFAKNELERERKDREKMFK
ncbi:MAG: hypothetical protein E7538_06750 [Ruminococcaceae bacterium]|nr:hypothetical protein [Oscillospiraceae bacterium]